MPDHHEVRAEDIDRKRLARCLPLPMTATYGQFAELLLLEGLGPRTLQSLALIAGGGARAASRFSDPRVFPLPMAVRIADPFPVPLKTYDNGSIFSGFTR